MEAKKVLKIRILDMIAADMKNDAEVFDRQPFNRSSVEEYFKSQGAAIVALATIIKENIKEN